MLLDIESVKVNPSGKSCMVKAGGREYFAKPSMNLSAGMKIDAETKDSVYNGKTNVWIEKYKEVKSDAHEAAAAAHRGNGVAPSGVAMPWLPMASNVVAHAIAAGKIETPAQVGAWIQAVRESVEKPF